MFASQSRAVLGLKFSLLIAHSHFFLLSAFLSPEGMLYILYPSQERLLHPNAQQNTMSNRKSVNTLLILLVWKKLVGTKMAAISHVTRFSQSACRDRRTIDVLTLPYGGLWAVRQYATKNTRDYTGNTRLHIIMQFIQRNIKRIFMF